MTARLQEIMTRLHFVDVWRELHPVSKMYSFYTPAHGACSRLDRILLANNGSLTVRRAVYQVTILSDNVSLVLECETRAPRPAVPLWRRHPEMLVDSKYSIDVLAALQGYIRENLNMAQTRRIEREALKVVVKGVSIGKVYGIRRRLEGELEQQEGALPLLQSQEGDGAVDEAGLLEVHKRIEVEWNKLDNLVQKDYRHWLHREGDCSGRMLVWLLKCERPPLLMLSLGGPAGDMILGQVRVNSLLRDHLRVVDASPVRVDGSQMDGYLVTLQLPPLKEMQTGDLEGDIQL
ncbi:hypothetical protein NDU88_003920 [Pleurodeles waltl]|uniref:Uncharacterized protein n=1 Tax=Pleurodeles waltl TaxID=8319 RepID=A0AAV7QE07_PLEWA|nr:hypothetical protein NDU88_003920 [Pleurodeles waltl]